jgi:hypothetical protein
MADYITTIFELGEGDPDEPMPLSPLPYLMTALRHHQVSVDGLDGGTYSVDVQTPGDETYQIDTTGATESDTVVIDALIVAAMQVRFAGLGEGAAPVVTLTSW